MDGLAFLNAPIDRDETLRRDPERLAALEHDPHARTLVYCDGKAALTGDRRRAWWANGTSDPANARERVFLGRSGDTPVFAAALPQDAAPPADDVQGEAKWSDLRRAAPGLPGDEGALLGLGRGLLEWHARHGFCANCGAASAPTDGGWKRYCSACGTTHFPRVDPVVIMAVVHAPKTADARLLLGRQPAWPPGFFSCLAGFVEAGETLEAAVVREVAEEAQIPARDPVYVAGQPWPFPSSLMLGMEAEALSTDAVPDGEELEALIWVTRAQARAMLNGEDLERFAPPASAIAHHLLARFAAG